MENTQHLSLSEPIAPYYYSKPVKDRYWLHILLFFLTFITTSMAGTEFVTNRSWVATWLFDAPERQLTLYDISKGFPYAIAFLTFLTFHEFGHYFVAVYHRVKCSLPYYIPVFIPFQLINIGSFGAVIRIREEPNTSIKYFDIGIAGPLAGFVISILLLVYGFTNLPPLDYLYTMNPDYLTRPGGIPTEAELDNIGTSIKLGNSLLFSILERTLADPSRLPNHYELIHYPFLFVGYLTLFFTALNLLPVGQLDGGHITYGMFGRKAANIISRITVCILLTIGGVGIIDFDFYPYWQLTYGLYLLFLTYVVSFLSKNVLSVVLMLLGILGAQQILNITYPQGGAQAMWLFYALLLVRFVRVEHPMAAYELPLTPARKILGWIALAIFVLCFTPAVIVVKNNSF